MTSPVVRAQGIIDSVDLPFDGSILLNKYDLMYLATDDVRPASSQADGGSEAANQASFVPLFVGVALDTRLAADTAAVAKFPVATDIVLGMDCASDTWEVGALFTVDEDAGGTFLEDQKLVKTVDGTLAIGYAVSRAGSAATRVLVRLMSRVFPHAAYPTALIPTSATLPVLIFNGATGANEIRVPTNLADALSIEDSAGDLIKFDTTTGTQVITITPAVTLAGNLTLSGGKDLIFSGTTGQSEIHLTDELADALSVKIAAGADFLAFNTTSGSESITVGQELIVGTKLTAAGSTFGPFLPIGAHAAAVAPAAAIPITNYFSTMNSTAGATTQTLADGAVIGHLKKIQLIVDGGDDVVTPANLAGGTIITFADAGDYALLMWSGTEWVAIELGNDADGATAPVLS